MDIGSKAKRLIGELGVGGATSYCLVNGGFRIHDYYSHVKSVRDAVYSRATEITPEVMDAVAEATDLISKEGLNWGLAQVAAAGYVAFKVYNRIRGSSGPVTRGRLRDIN